LINIERNRTLSVGNRSILVKILDFLDYFSGEIADKMNFWYSKKMVVCGLAVLFLIVLSVSYLIPPFQSPDEFNHIKRAYLLSKGEIFLGAQKGITGGNIDHGLLRYMRAYSQLPWHYEKKVLYSKYKTFSKIKWSKNRIFNGLPNTALYFPLPYLPQASALFIGEKAGLTIKSSYYLARIFALVAALLILGYALVIFPAPPFILALFLTPMSIFQLGSASLDGVTFSLSVLCAGLFMRGALPNRPLSKPMLYMLSLSIFVLATTRFNLIPLVLLPGFLYFVNRNKAYLIHSCFLILFSLIWLVIALQTIHGGWKEFLYLNEYSQQQLIASGSIDSLISTKGPATGEIILYYIRSPHLFGKILFTTITDINMLDLYWQSFIGILGWMDAPLLKYKFYVIFTVLLCILALVSVKWENPFVGKSHRIWLALMVFFSLLLLFFIFLTSWNSFPAEIIDEIQGRYFTTMLILLGFALLSPSLSHSKIKICIGLLFVLCILSTYFTSSCLFERYWNIF